jgi:hypothetical protein
LWYWFIKTLEKTKQKNKEIDFRYFSHFQQKKKKKTMNNSMMKSLSLYRQLLRTSKSLPINLDVKRKIIYNIQEIFRIRKLAHPQKTILHQEDGMFALDMLKRMHTISKPVK